MERAAEQRVREEETEMMRTLVLENFEAEKRERVHKVERREAEKRELIESNRALLELRAKEAALVEQEEAMIRVYKEKKARPARQSAPSRADGVRVAPTPHSPPRQERNVQQRREKEAAMFKAKQEQRQHLIDTQSAQLAAMTSDAEARLDAQMAEVENKAKPAPMPAQGPSRAPTGDGEVIWGESDSGSFCNPGATDDARASQASEARARKEEKRKDDLLIMHMSRQRQIRWKAEKRLQEEADSRHLAESQARRSPCIVAAHCHLDAYGAVALPREPWRHGGQPLSISSLDAPFPPSQAALNRELQMEEDAELRAVIDRRKEYDKVRPRP